MSNYYVTIYVDASLPNLKGSIHTWSELSNSDGEVIAYSFQAPTDGNSKENLFGNNPGSFELTDDIDKSRATAHQVFTISKDQYEFIKSEGTKLILESESGDLPYHLLAEKGGNNCVTMTKKIIGN